MFADPIWGYIPSMLNPVDPRSAIEQLHAGYQHGGGWKPFKGFKRIDGDIFTLQYPNDPPIRPLDRMNFKEDIIAIYDGAWVAVFHPDGWEISRMD